MEGILLVGKFTDNFRTINRCLIGKYEIRSCLKQLSMIEGLVQKKEPELIALVLDEDEEKEKPKRKKLMHLAPTRTVLEEQDYPTNNRLKQVLAAFGRPGPMHEGGQELV